MSVLGFKPWCRVHRLAEVDPADLEALGVRLVLLDRDNTCVPRGEHDPAPDVVAWCERARELGLRLALVSNNWSVAALKTTSAALEAPVVTFALKPLPFGLWSAMEAAGVPAEQTVLVGDQLFTDGLGSLLANIPVILVDPQSTRDLFYTRWLRPLEARLMEDVPYGWERARAERARARGADSGGKAS